MCALQRLRSFIIQVEAMKVRAGNEPVQHLAASVYETCVSFECVLSSLAITDIRWRWSECTMQFNDVATPGQDSECAQRKK